MDPTYQLDLIWMTLLIFLPSIFALALLCFPKGSDEWMRWWALLGTAAALSVSLAILIFYNRALEFHGVRQQRTLREHISLPHRFAQLDLVAPAVAPNAPPATNPARSDDWVARIPWVSQFNINYSVGVDGISITLVLMTTALFFLTVLASWTIPKFTRGYLILLLLLETGVLGTFLALDFFLFFVFFEIVLLPMYFLIGIWGGPERVYAAIKFFLYTFVGSVLILLALVALYFVNVRDFVDPGTVEKEASLLADNDPSQEPRPKKLARALQVVQINTFEITTLQRVGRAALQHLRGEPLTNVPAIDIREKELARVRAEAKEPERIPVLEQELEQARAGLAERLRTEWFFQPWFQYTIFSLLFVGFAIKIPVVPLHTWLPTAHVEAPTPVSMILAGVLLKLGAYGLMRIAYPICPFAAEKLAWVLALLGVINIVYGALAAMAQEDFKKLVAYSSISHMGYVLLGLSVWTTADRSAYWAWGANGALYLMIAHGITSAGMFFLVGMIAERVKHRRLDLMRGLAEPMPVTAGLCAVIFFAAMGLPGLCGFVGEFMIFVGAWNYSTVFACIAILTTVLTAGYVLWTIQRVFLGANSQFKDAKDATPLEALTGFLLATLCIVLGVFPWLVLTWSEPSVTGLVDTLVRMSPPFLQ